IFTALYLINISINLFSQYTVSSYPPSKRAPVTDDYFGTKITDNYRWMENMNDPDVQQWFKDQGEFSQNILDKIPGRDMLYNEFLHLDSMRTFVISDIQREWTEGPGKSPRYFYLKELKGESVFKLYYKDGLNGNEIPLYDPLKFETGKVYSIQYYKPSNDGKKLALGLSESGSEQARILIMDVDTKKLYDESIFPSWFGVTDWLDDNSAFIYTSQKSGNTSSQDLVLNTSVKVHEPGTDVSSDRIIFSAEKYPSLGILPDDILFLGYSDDRKFIVAVRGGVQHQQICFFAPAKELESKNIKWKKLFEKEDEVTNFIFANDSIYYLTDKNTPNSKVLVTSAKTPDLSKARLVIPEGKDHIQYITRSENYMFIEYSNGITSHVVKYRFKNGTSFDVAIPNAVNVSPYDIYDDNSIITTTYWTLPTKRYDYNAVDNKTTISVFNTLIDFPGQETLVAKEVEVPGYDGTLVPLSIIMDKNTKLDGNNVCYISGYGAYGISTTPFFSFINLDLIQHGVIIAYAHVRGGGEKGNDWYLGGFKTTKPNTWKDFISCAEYLINQKYTSNTHLFGEGTSAGGILIGRAITERPDLFAAAICNVGVLNVLRAEESPGGPNNTREFGTVNNEEECKAMIDMDALSHVKEGVNYPAVLCNTGINDPRVAPWEPGKFAAALQFSSASGKPVLLRVDYKSGHFSEEKTVSFKEEADFMAFCLWQSGHPDFQLK
ncbi:MAG: prolyl oligopeptidase family serine peptidase, partial [Ignavibacteria bacterium]